MSQSEAQMPLDRFQLYQVCRPRDYLDRSLSRSRRMFVDVRSFEFLGSDGTLLRTNGVHLHGAQLAVVGTSGHRIRLNDELNDAVFIPLRGRIEVKRRHCQNTARPGEMIIATPGERMTTLGEDYLGIVILLPRALLAERSGLCEPDSVPILLDRGDEASAGGVGGLLRRQILLLIDELDRSDVLLHSERLARSSINMIADLAVEQCVAAGLGRAMREPVKRGSERHVRLAEEFMRANVAEPISIGDVAAATGLNLRSLQAAFRSCRGTSPKAFLTARRLERARIRLLDASPCDSVTSIIYECGLTNAGRFAGEYRSKYGEYPSETLAAARPDQGAI